MRRRQPVDAKLCRRRPGKQHGSGHDEAERPAAPIEGSRDGSEHRRCAEQGRRERLARQREIHSRAGAEDDGEPLEAAALGEFPIKPGAKRRAEIGGAPAHMPQERRRPFGERRAGLCPACRRAVVHTPPQALAQRVGHATSGGPACRVAPPACIARTASPSWPAPWRRCRGARPCARRRACRARNPRHDGNSPGARTAWARPGCRRLPPAPACSP